MTVSLIETLVARESRALEAAEDAAAKMRDARSPVESVQLALETALGDLAHYRALTTQVADVARSGGPYRPGSPFSFVRDVVEAVARLEGRAVTTGNFVGVTVPQYLADLAAPAIRSSAPLTAYLARPLPELGTSVVISTWTTAHTAEAQSSENTTATATTLAQGTATLVVKSYDVRSDVSYHLLDRTNAVDGTIVPDQIAALAAKVETDVIAGDGTSGTLTGFLSAASTTAQTYTDASPTGGELLHEIEKAYRASVAARGQASGMLAVMHPRRWSFFREKLATEGLTAGVNTSSNPAAVARHGDVDIVASPAVPTNLGAGTNEDRVLVFPADCAALLTSGPTIEVSVQAGAGGMTANVVGYQYAALNVGRGIPSAVVVVGGTGLVAP